MTTTWQIFDTKYQTADGLITDVVYGCTAKLEQEVSRVVAEVQLTGNSSTQGFIPYSELSESILVEWVKQLLGAEQVATIEASIQQSLLDKKAAQQAQVVKNGLPWS